MPNPPATPLTRRFVAGGVAVLAALLVGGGVAVAATRAVQISDFAFSPRSITINVGDRVTWTNADAVIHTATATNGAFDTGNIEQGESRSVRFTIAGTYRYLCTPHPTMTGTIRVRAAAGGPTLPATDTVVQVGATEAGTVGAGASTMPALLAAAATLVVALAIVRRRLLV